MIVLAAAVLAATAAWSAVAAVAVRSRGSVLAFMTPAPAPSNDTSLLKIVGSAPVIRKIAPSKRVARRLETGTDALSDRDVVGVQVLAASTMILASAAAGMILLAGPLVVVAWHVPGFAIARRARRRRAVADREVPMLLDLLAVATSAGLPPQLALRRAVDAADGPLAEELAAVLRSTDLGGRWRDGLTAAAERLGLPDLDRMVGALTRSEALGSSLAGEVARLAADVREARRTAATERARSAPVKMLFPLVFLVLPAFLLLTVVPVLVATVESLS